MSQFDLVKPEDPAYDMIDRALSANTPKERFNYDPFARAYNDASIGSVLLLGLHPNSRRTNVISVLEGRGLVYDIDFTVTKIIYDMEKKMLPKDRRHMAIKKLSEAQLRLTGNGSSNA